MSHDCFFYIRPLRLEHEAQHGKGTSLIFVCEIRFDWLTVLSAVEGRHTLHERRSICLPCSQAGIDLDIIGSRLIGERRPAPENTRYTSAS
jgi:hypothetical protein